MFSRTSGGIAGFSANCDSGSPGASARIAKTTKLMSSKVGMAMRSRRPMYLPTLGNYETSRRGSCAPPARSRCRVRPVLLGPVGDVPHLRVPWVRLDALECLADAGDGRLARDERDDHHVGDEEVIHLDDDVVALRRVVLGLQRREERVVILAAPPLVVVA